MIWIVAVVLAMVLIAAWWIKAAPRPEIREHISESIVFDPATARAVAAVDRSAEFAAGLEQLTSNVPPYDDGVILDDGATALVTTHDGKIWKLDLATSAAEPFVETSLMPWGIQKATGDPNHVYFCASGFYGKGTQGKAPGLYRLALDTLLIEPVALQVPDTVIDHKHPVVFADSDPQAPEYRPDGSGGPSRPVVVCDNLEVSTDGRRIYFSEPFSYEHASLGDTVDEAIALARNGRLWRHDLDTGVTRLIAEGFRFINGVLCDPHPGQAREASVLVTETSLCRLTRFYLRGPKAASSEVVLDGLPGTPDGIDRDAAGRIWLSLFSLRPRLLTWVHAHAWIKPLIMRLPTRLLLSQQRGTGIVVVSPDGSQPLYAASYRGSGLTSISSAIASTYGIYLANVSLLNPDSTKTGIQRLKWPAQLASPDLRP